MTEQETGASPQGSGARWLVWGFAAIGVLAALAIIWLVVMLNSNGFRREPAVVAARAPGETFEVGAVEQLAGTNLVSIDIRLSERAYGSGSIKSSGQQNLRNVLLLDRTTGESRRLLPDNRQSIASISFLPAEAQDSVSAVGEGTRRVVPPAYYLMALVVKRGDDQTISLLAGSLAGPEQQTVMQGLEGVERKWMIDSRRLGLIVREGKALYFRVIDMVDRKVLQSRKIDIG
jgi:hypothetical protein